MIKSSTKNLNYLIKKEEESQLYNIQIDQFTVYNLLRRDLRSRFLKSKGDNPMPLKTKVSKTAVISNLWLSFIQVLKLLVLRPKYVNVFRSFPRLDRIGGVYVDKFSDPYIEISELSDYVIFEHNKGGVRRKPRAHAEKIIDITCIVIFSKIWSSIFYKIYYYVHRRCFYKLLKELQNVYGDTMINPHYISKIVYENICLTKAYMTLLRAVSAKNIYAPARPANIFTAAKHLGVMRYEIQHGITYAETVLYSGRQHEELVPEFFLAFGHNDPQNVYGIPEDRILTVGWPLFEYLKERICINEYGDKDCLVISEHKVSDSIISATLSLAKYYPMSHFYIRPHPQEYYSKEQLDRIHSLPNVHVNDNKINIAEVLAGFKNVLGENSTVMYEALGLNKKVGKLYMDGLNPLYLNPNDKESFWVIRKYDDLQMMLNASPDDKPHKSIYSEFNSQLYMNITGCK